MNSSIGYELKVMSDEMIPYGLPKGAEIFIIDKMDVAIASGRNTVYRVADTPVAAGKPWSALFE